MPNDAQNLFDLLVGLSLDQGEVEESALVFCHHFKLAVF
jgi:hypothetical protein